MRSDRARARAFAPLAAAVLLTVALTGCAPTLDGDRPSGRRTVDPAATGSAAAGATAVPIPFEPVSFPSDGDAPCGEVEPPTAGQAPYRGTLRRIEAVDERTVRFSLCEPDVAFRTRVASPALTIDDTGWLLSNLRPDADPTAAGESPNGTGQFRLDVWREGNEIILAPFERYRGDAPATGDVVIRWEPDAGKRLDALIDSSVDGIDALDAATVVRASENPDVAVVARDGLNTMYLGMNAAYAPFDQVEVRRAIAMGIDRDAIVEAAFPAGTAVASHFSPCAIRNACAGETWWPYDVALAKERLDAAGVPDGFETTIHVGDAARDYLPDPAAAARELQRQLATNLGITATIETLPFDELVAGADAGSLEGIHLLGSRVIVPDANAFLDPRFGDGAPPEFGPVDETLVGALEDAAASVGDEPRAEAMARANDRIRSRAPAIPIAHVGSTAAIRADVTGLVTSPTGTERFADVIPGDRSQFVWMGATEPSSLYCPDASDTDAMRVCTQIAQGLYAFADGDARPVPALAETCTPNDALDEWTCTIRAGVTFHDGARLDAGDVATSYAVQWDAAHPLHRDDDGAYAAFRERFGGFLHEPQSEPATP